MTHAPVLTVLMPVYNAEDYLSDAIESVLNQTFARFELLIINDGSTDRSQEIIDRFVSQDSRVRSIRQPNMGIVKTLNRGIELSTTELIARHDADDLSLPGRFERQVAFLETNPDCALVGTAAEVFSDSVTHRQVFPFCFHEQIGDAFLFGNTFVHGSVMFRREAILKAGLYSESPGARHIEDFDLWARLARKYRIANLGETLYRYRDHPSSISNSQSNTQRENTRRLTEVIRKEKWHHDFWNISGFNSSRWNHLPSPAAKENLINLQIRTLIALAALGEWKAFIVRLCAAFSHPIRFLLGTAEWTAKVGVPRLFR
ncbi:MAG: glycosyltransferase family 2 protein [Bdellovibrionia bacterium]